MEIDPNDYDTETLNLVYDMTVVGIGANVRPLPFFLFTVQTL